MKHILIAYGIAVASLALLYLLFVWFFMRLSRRRAEYRLEEAQEAINDSGDTA